MRAVLAGVVVLGLAACVPTTQTVSTPSAPAGAVTAQVSGGNFTAMVNGQRAANGRSALRTNSQLAAAARAHAADMAQRGYFAHRSPEGRDMASRARTAGYCYRALAENIAEGQRSEAEVLTGWMNSPGHRRNILNPAMTEYGLGRANNYWVMVLGGPC